jgi:uncharacterized protein YqgC (DUF456 family)
MNVVLIAAAICLAIVGIVGAIVPGIAGPPFSFLSLLTVSFVEGVEHSATFLIVMGIIAAVVFALDYVVPILGTKKFGGSKAGMWGSTIGLLAGLTLTLFFNFAFIAILAGPFFGAYIGERIVKTPNKQAWKAAFGSFVGFLLGTLLKLVFAFVCLVFIVKDLIGLLA